MRISIILILIFIGIGCSSPPKNIQVEADSLYDQSVKAYDEYDYRKTIKLLEQLEADYPFSRYTKDGLLMLAHSHFELEEYNKSSLSLNRYLEIYPSAENVDYALYLLGLSYYNRITNAQRDQSFAVTARKHFNQLIGRYPDSEYFADAQIKRDFVVDHLASKEMVIGRFYLEEDQIPAAINRFKNIVNNYDTTSHIQEALYRLVESYLILGLYDLAHDAAYLLGYNHPSSHWYHDAYALMEKHKS